MYTINVKNNFPFAIDFATGGVSISSGTSYSTAPLGGTQVFNVPGIDSVCIIDLGQAQLSGYSLNGTWGLLVRYQTIEIYLRYEGTAQMNFTFDNCGDLTVNVANGNAIPIQLPGLILS